MHKFLTTIDKSRIFLEAMSERNKCEWSSKGAESVDFPLSNAIPLLLLMRKLFIFLFSKEVLFNENYK